jgi:hypothetical protein
MRDRHYEPGNNLRMDIEVSLTGAGHLYDAKTAQLETDAWMVVDCLSGRSERSTVSKFKI